MRHSECNCFLQFLKPGMENLWGIICIVFSTSSWSYIPPAGLFAGLHWFLLLVKVPQDHTRFSGRGFLLTGFGGESEGNWCVPSTSWCPKSLHSLQRLPRVHLVLSNSFVSSGTVQDFGLIFFSLWHPDWPLRPMGSPPAWKGTITKVNPSDLVW